MQQCLSRSVETNYNDFKSFVDSVMDACIPTKMTSSRDNMPWFNNTLKRMCKEKQRLFNKAKKTKRAQHWEQYKSFKKDTLKAIKKFFFHNWYPFRENRFLTGTRNDVTTFVPLVAGDDSGVI